MLALIPARGGSKGIPNKNTAVVAEKPLLFWSIDRSLESKNITKTIVSSDSDDILSIVKDAYGSSVELHKRSKDLASDDSKTVDLLQHIAELYKLTDHIVLLQPTSPMRRIGFIDDLINAHISAGNDLTVSGYYSTDFPFGKYNNIPRQNLSALFYDDGSVYVFKYSAARAGNWIPENWAPYVNDFPYTMEIDTKDELELIREIFLKYYKL